ncbi:MAG: response regulator [Pseudomonadota bacterium]|nr:response regulator [Pseudomonadota bacterium]
MNSRLRPILLAEDDDYDAEFTIEALVAAGINNPVVRVADGDEALDYLNHQGKFSTRSDAEPMVVILDIKMPRVDGHEVLERMRSDPKLRRFPVVMLTSSRHEADLARSWGAGVNAYVLKPVSPTQYEEAVKTLGAFWATLNQVPDDD